MHYQRFNKHGDDNASAIKHGYSGHPEYRAWQDMKNRCYNKKLKNYKHYGGRGITVCERWLQSFQNFLDDMGERPKKMSLDRIDNNGNYEPVNCRWASQQIQRYNSRSLTNSSSGYKGVTWHKKAKKWQAQIVYNKKCIFLGYFTDVNDAINARKSGELKIYKLL